jgi:hypothetical protein
MADSNQRGSSWNLFNYLYRRRRAYFICTFEELAASKETKVFEICTPFHILPCSFIASIILLTKLTNTGCVINRIVQ